LQVNAPRMLSTGPWVTCSGGAGRLSLFSQAAGPAAQIASPARNAQHRGILRRLLSTPELYHGGRTDEASTCPANHGLKLAAGGRPSPDRQATETLER
jgi:hypothetical protein